MRHRTEDNWIGAIVIAVTLVICACLAANAGEDHDQGATPGAAVDLTEEDIVVALESRIPEAAAFLLAHGHDVWWCMGNCGNRNLLLSEQGGCVRSHELGAARGSEG